MTLIHGMPDTLTDSFQCNAKLKDAHHEMINIIKKDYQNLLMEKTRALKQETMPTFFRAASKENTGNRNPYKIEMLEQVQVKKTLAGRDHIKKTLERRDQIKKTLERRDQIKKTLEKRYHIYHYNQVK